MYDNLTVRGIGRIIGNTRSRLEAKCKLGLLNRHTYKLYIWSFSYMHSGPPHVLLV